MYTYGSTKAEVAEKLSKGHGYGCNMVGKILLTGQLVKAVAMFLSKSCEKTEDPEITAAGDKLQIVQDYKYLGIYLDSNLNFRINVKHLGKIFQF